MFYIFFSLSPLFVFNDLLVKVCPQQIQINTFSMVRHILQLDSSIPIAFLPPPPPLPPWIVPRIEKQCAPKSPRLDAGRLQLHVLRPVLVHQPTHDHLHHHLHVRVVCVLCKHFTQLLHEPRTLLHVPMRLKPCKDPPSHNKFTRLTHEHHPP